MKATSSNGCARRYRRIHLPWCTALPPTRRSGRRSGRTWRSPSRRSTSATLASALTESSKTSGRTAFFGLVGLVGVQSNQFPRALDIARPLRQAGIPVVIGGFHVSGCLAMLPDLQDDVKAALEIGATLFAGELEGRID